MSESKASQFIKDNFGGMLGLAPGSDLMLAQVENLLSQISNLTGSDLGGILDPAQQEQQQGINPGKKKKPLPSGGTADTMEAQGSPSLLLNQLLGRNI